MTLRIYLKVLLITYAILIATILFATFSTLAAEPNADDVLQEVASRMSVEHKATFSFNRRPEKIFNFKVGSNAHQLLLGGVVTVYNSSPDPDISPIESAKGRMLQLLNEVCLRMDGELSYTSTNASESQSTQDIQKRNNGRGLMIDEYVTHVPVQSSSICEVQDEK